MLYSRELAVDGDFKLKGNVKDHIQPCQAKVSAAIIISFILISGLDEKQQR